MAREARDNAVAAEKSLKPYTFLNVEICDGSDAQSANYLGWYYATVAVDGKVFALIETELSHDIARGEFGEDRRNYFVAGGLKEDQADFVFNNVGHASTSGMYKIYLNDNARDRAEKTLNERLGGFDVNPRRRPSALDKLAAAKDSVAKTTAEKTAGPEQSADKPKPRGPEL